MCDTALQTWDVISTRLCENVVCNKIQLQPEALVLSFNTTIPYLYYPLALIFMYHQRSSVGNKTTKWSYILKCKNDTESENEDMMFEYTEEDINCAISKFHNLTNLLIKNNQNEAVISTKKPTSTTSATKQNYAFDIQSMADSFIVLDVVHTTLFGLFLVFAGVLLWKNAPFFRKQQSEKRNIKNEFV